MATKTKKFTIVNSGASGDAFYILIEDKSSNDDFIPSAFIKTKKEMKVGSEIEIPEQLVKSIRWRL